jgi:hypothetical protein
MTHHVTADPTRCFTLEELVEETHRGFAEIDPEWARRGVEPPAIVPAHTYALFERTVSEAGDRALAAVVGAMGTFVPQLLYPKRFDRTNTTQALPEWDPPHVRDYYQKVLSNLVATRRGRRLRESAEVASS